MDADWNMFGRSCQLLTRSASKNSKDNPFSVKCTEKGATKKWWLEFNINNWFHLIRLWKTKSSFYFWQKGLSFLYLRAILTSASWSSPRPLVEKVLPGEVSPVYYHSGPANAERTPHFCNKTTKAFNAKQETYCTLIKCPLFQENK